MHLSICTITARAMPRYDWLIDGLAAQAQPDDDIELVIIDFHDRGDAELVPNRSSAPALRRVKICPPKPNPWQGTYRVTRRDLHAIAHARNTALCLASHDFVAFVDDRIRLGPAWLDTVRAAEAVRTRAICGPYDRDQLGTGRLFDDRISRAPGGRTRCSGDWFYGGNFALPLAWALEINGCEEGTDPVGRQDRIMGHMLVNSGYRIDFVVGMSALVDRRLTTAHPFPRVGKGVPPADKGRAIMRRFASRRRTEMTPDLTAIRAAVQRGAPFPMHDAAATDLDWFDDQPIGDM